LCGIENVSYNVHSLIHLAQDVQSFGHLDGYSAFRFENFMQIMKKLVRKSSFPIQQIRNRLKEKEQFTDAKNELTYINVLRNILTKYPNNYCIVNDYVLKIKHISIDIV